MLTLENERFNVKGYSREFNISRSTVKDALERLRIKKLIEHPFTGMWRITHVGETILNAQEGVAGTSRRGWRGAALSQHYTKYIVPIKDRSKFNPQNMKGIKRVDLPNMTTYYLYLENSTIRITSKQYIIHVHDIIAKDTDESFFESFAEAMKHITFLEGQGLIGEKVIMDRPHYARINSVLSEVLEKIDEHYFLDLGKGRKLWVDHSNDKREDETNDEETRKKLDKLIKDLVDSNAEFADIDKITEALSHLTKLKFLEEKAPTNNELSKLLGEVAEINKETASGIQAMVKLSNMQHKVTVQSKGGEAGRIDYVL